MANFFYLIFLVQLSVVIGLTNGLECYSCVSSILPDCAKNPSKLSDKVQCEDECVTAIIDRGHTFRGCAPVESMFSDLSKTCNTDLCNKEIYPDDRLQCHQCSGKTCVRIPAANTLTPCIKYDPKDICFTQIESANNGVRGCLGDMETIPDFIEPCYKSGCNNQNGILPVNCIQCASSTDKDCVRSAKENEPVPSTKSCEVPTYLGQNKTSCFTYHKFDSVIRDCIYHKETFDLDLDYLTECKGELCNSISLPVEKCAVCGVGTKDVSCIFNKIEKCKIEESNCYACFGEHRNQTSRGCGSGVPAASRVGCYQCQDKEGCNLQDPRKCLKCNSKDQPECAYLTNFTGIPKEICETPNSMCVTAVDKKGYVERECRSGDFDSSKYLHSKECSGQYCNNAILPEKQLRCFTCRTNDECGLDTDSMPLLPCNRLDINNECYEFVKDDEHVIRGCKTDDGYKECSKLGEECKKCNEVGCNKNLAVWKKPKISCFNCDESDEKCQWTQKDESIKNCTSKIPADRSELCYSINYEDGKFARGCSWDDNICKDENAIKCSVCDSSNCNKDLLKAENCVQGNVTDDGKGETKKNDCPAKIQYFEDQGCYVQRNGSTVAWGCKNEMTKELLDYCSSKTEMCKTCQGQSCEDMKAPSKASNTLPGIYAFLLVQIVFISKKFI